MKTVECKKIKDPVYGYISIPGNYITDIVDTSVFQRLRRVIQTSYSPLYVSALHNRFAHSLGVFHLGNIAAECLKNVVLERGYLDQSVIGEYASTYQIACLLHDIGHAPFSHTGEIYYKDDNFQVTELHKRLCSMFSSDLFEADLPSESESAAPHEIMSAIIGIKEFGNIIGDGGNKELFARCITGYKYPEGSAENEIRNCFISMLNSKVIDVDRLDYLLRDAYTSGFATTDIDYIRLLEALTIIRYNGHYKMAYKKNAVSIIENVVYAHDAERKWIQNHPTVVYEAYLLKRILENLNTNLNKGKQKLFSEQSLSKTGHKLKGGYRISLMCDDDIIYLAKNVFPGAISEEFFERKSRRHPVWKSEAEYKAYIGGISTGGEHKDRFMECMKAFNASNIPEHPVPMIIDDELIRQFEKELEKSEREENPDSSQIKAIKRKLNVCRYLSEYVTPRKIPFEFIIIPANMFISNFSKQHLAETLIVFGDNAKVKKLKEVCNLLKSEFEEKDFYYLFYKRGKKTEESSGQIDDLSGFCEGLFNSAL